MKRQNNNSEIKIEITAVYKVQRSDELLEFLFKKIKNSRNNIKMLLSNHQILVNGVVVTRYDFSLAKDDEVKISKKPIHFQNKDERTNRVRVPRMEIIYEDEDFIAIDKPHGLLAVESDKEQTKTAYNYILQYLQYKNKDVRPYVIHRIDKETSGVLVFTKNIKLHSILRMNWNDYVKTREYYALVEGKVEASGVIKSKLLSNQNNIMYSSNTNEGKLAITNYQVIKASEKYTLLKVLIDTGKKNQIRVHMKESGYPIVGDDKYGGGKDPISRLGLHASCLEFIHPLTKNLISIKSPMPNVFNSLFRK